MHSEYIVTIYSEEDGDEWSDKDDVGCLEYYKTIYYKNKAAEDVKRNFGLIKGKHFIISLSDYCFRSKFEEGKHILYLVNLSS